MTAALLLLAPDARAEECVFDPDDTMGASSVSGAGATACGADSSAQGIGSSAIGSSAKALDSHAIAVGMGALATRLDSEAPIDVADISTTFAALAMGAQAAAAGFDSIAIGRGAIAGTISDPDANDGTYALGLADFAIAIGGMANASEEFAVALGQGSSASGQRALAFGSGSEASGLGSIAIGADGGDGDDFGALAQAANAIALGADAVVNSGATDGIAIGRGASTSDTLSAAIGSGARANGNGALAMGQVAFASGQFSTAVGQNSQAQTTGALAFGAGSVAANANSMALGNNATATGDKGLAIGRLATAAFEGTAIGFSASATGNRAAAIGSTANASGNNSVALGTFSSAVHANSVAIGVNSATNRASQIKLGGAGTSVTIGDIDASTAAQSGQLYAVTVDDSGTLGKGGALASAQAVASLGNSFRQVASFHEAEIAALDSRVASLEGSVTTLFDLTEIDRKDTRQGLAAIAAMAQPHFPSEPGKTSYASNVAVHRGEVGVSAGLMHRFDGDFALTAGATYAGGDSATFKAGIAGEF